MEQSKESIHLDFDREFYDVGLTERYRAVNVSKRLSKKKALNALRQISTLFISFILLSYLQVVCYCAVIRLETSQFPDLKLQVGSQYLLEYGPAKSSATEPEFQTVVNITDNIARYGFPPLHAAFPTKGYVISLSKLSINATRETIFVASSPNPPDDVIVTVISSRIARIDWRPPRKGMYNAFRLRYSLESDSSKEKQWNLSGNSSGIIDSKKSSTQLDDLLPGGTYRVNVSSLFMSNNSAKRYELESEGTDFLWTMHPGAVVDLREEVVQTTDSSATVSWVEPEGIYDSFVARITGPSTDKTLTVQASSASRLFAAFQDLDPGVVYNITVVTVVNNRISSEMTTIRVATIPEPPASFTRVLTSGSSSEIQWGAPLEGSADGYRVSITPNENIQIDVNQLEQAAQIRNLKQGTTYKVSVQSVSGDAGNFKYSSQLSQLLVPNPLPPTSIWPVVEATTTNSIAVVWNAPGELVDGYEITLRDTKIPSKIVKRQGEKQTITFDGLEAARSYNVDIVSIVNIDADEPVKSQVTSTVVKTLPNIVSDLRATALNKTSIQVSWLTDVYPEKPNDPIKGLEYNVKITKKSEPFRIINNIDVPGNQLARTIVDIGDLETAVHYVVDVVARYYSLPGENTKLDVFTSREIEFNIVPKEKMVNGRVHTSSFQINIPNVSHLLKSINNRNKIITIKYRSDDTEESGTQSVDLTSLVADAGNDGSGKVNVGPLTAGAEYDIVVSANEKELFRTSEIMNPQSPLDARGGPGDSDALEGTSSLIVSWQPPDTRYDGFLFRYGIEGDKFKETLIMSENVGKERLRYELPGLEPGTTYQIQVFTVSRQRRSTVFAEFSSTTRPVAPENFKVSKVSYESIILSWDAPNSGNFSHFILEAENLNSSLFASLHTTSSDSYRKRQQWTIKSTDLEFELPIQPSETVMCCTGAAYAFNIFSVADEGKKSERKTVTARSLPPTIAILQSGVSVINSTTIQAHIQVDYPPRLSVYDTIIFEMNSTSVDIESHSRQFKFATGHGNGPEFNAMPQWRRNPVSLSDLSPGVTYILQGWTVSGGVRGKSSNPTKVVMKPEKVANIKLEEKGKTYLKFSWQPTEIEFSHFDGFELTSNGTDESIRFGKQVNNFTMSGLKPFKTYLVSLITLSKNQRSEPYSETFTTLEDIPGPIRSVNDQKLGPRKLKVEWTPPDEPNGIITQYVLEYRGRSRDSQVRSRKFPADTLTTILDDLVPGVGYKLAIHATNRIGAGKVFGVEVTPMPVRRPLLSITNPKPVLVNSTENSITIQFSKNMFDDRNGEVRGYTIIVSRKENIPSAEDNEVFSASDAKARADFIHSIPTWVDIQNKENWDMYQAVSLFNPFNSSKARIQTRSAPDEKETRLAQVEEIATVSIGNDNECASRLSPLNLKTRSTRATKVQVNLLKQNSNSREAKSINGNMPSLADEVTPTFRAKKYELSEPVQQVAPFNDYEPAMKRYENPSRGASERSIPGNEFCNGPLEEGETYYVRVRAFSSPLYYTDSLPIMVKTSGGTVLSQNMLLIAILVPLLIILLAVILLAYCRFRSGKGSMNVKRTRKISRTFDDKLSEAESVTEKSRPILVEDFIRKARSMSADSDFLFSEEYEDLKNVGKDQGAVSADLGVNRPKNRFTNILPFDHSRVKLRQIDDDEGSDYINASFMPGYNGPREFIVTQGPLHSTRDDFWRCAWEQNVHAIVMLTRCIEKGREKCDHYWPYETEPVFYGDIQVTTLNETHQTDWTVRTFKVTKGDVTRTILHFHFTAWPDFGVPEYPQVLVNFIRAFRDRHPPDSKPIICHCSAGVGRSGTFIVLDRILQQLEQAKRTTGFRATSPLSQRTPAVQELYGEVYLDIYGAVYEMRHERCAMVQTEQQYIYIHQCIMCVLEGREKEDVGLTYGDNIGAVSNRIAHDTSLRQNAYPQGYFSHRRNNAAGAIDNLGYDDDEGIAESGPF